MTILDIELQTGLPRASVRFYEKKGLLNPVRGANGYREYSRDDLLQLNKVKLLRQLGIPLSDIQAMHSGDADITDVLNARIAEIAAEQERQAVQKSICGEILGTLPTYRDLDVERFLNMLKADAGESLNTPPRPKAGDLLRRAVARIIDLGVYCMFYNAYTYFILHRNAQWWLSVNLIFCCLIMLVVEPLLISSIKTTPGKLVFGIKVTDYDGARITILESYVRFYRMLSCGLGFVIIPVYNLYRVYKTFREYMELGVTKWDEDYTYTVNCRKLRTFAGVICALAIAATLFVSPYITDMPRYRGDLTLEHFAGNVNRYMRNHYIDESVGRRHDGVFGYLDLQPGTRWSAGGRTTGSRTYGAEIPVVVTDGYVTEVSLRRDNISETSSAAFIESVAYPLYNAFALSQKSITLFSMMFGNERTLLDRITESAWGDADTFLFVVGDVEVVFTYEFVRNKVYANATEPVYDIQFRMTKTA